MSTNIVILIILAIAVGTDLWARKIPNVLTVPAAVGGLVFHLATTGLPGLKSSISQEGASRLLSYPWKGNVREMRNAIERVVLYEEDSEVRVEHLVFLESSWPEGDDSASGFSLPSEGVDIEDVFRELIVQALDRAQDNQSKAARLLGISLPTFRYRMEKYGLKS